MVELYTLILLVETLWFGFVVTVAISPFDYSQYECWSFFLPFISLDIFWLTARITLIHPELHLWILFVFNKYNIRVISLQRTCMLLVVALLKDDPAIMAVIIRDFRIRSIKYHLVYSNKDCIIFSHCIGRHMVIHGNSISRWEGFDIFD